MNWLEALTRQGVEHKLQDAIREAVEVFGWENARTFCLETLDEFDEDIEDSLTRP
jgi:hypothetical protein